MTRLCAFAACSLAVALAACTGDDSNAPGPVDATAPDASVDAADAGAEDSAIVCTPGLDASPYCDGSTCITRDETLVPSAWVCDAIGPAVAGDFPCEGNTVVFLGETSGFSVLWFDGAGALLAVAGGADVGNGISRCASRDGVFPIPPLCSGTSTGLAQVLGGATIDFDLGCRCPPQPPAANAPPSVVVVPATSPGACSDGQLSALTDCAFGRSDGGACDALHDAGAASDRACAACLFGDGTNGAIRLHGAGTSNPRANVAGCLAFREGDAGAGSCATAYATAADCAASACGEQCFSASPDTEFACNARAITGGCGAALAATTCLGGDAGPSALATACGVGAALDDQVSVVARTFCGARVTDAGAD